MAGRDKGGELVKRSTYGPIRSKVLTVRELCDYLRVHPSTIYRLMKDRQLPGFRIGSDWRFNIEEVERWCTQLEAASHEVGGERG
jgi:excisionase family DNA binding protein